MGKGLIDRGQEVKTRKSRKEIGEYFEKVEIADKERNREKMR